LALVSALVFRAWRDKAKLDSGQTEGATLERIKQGTNQLVPDRKAKIPISDKGLARNFGVKI
jgi:hypothetical protein